MIVKADVNGNVTLHLAEPGDRFDVQVSGDGQFILTRLGPVSSRPPSMVRIEERGRFHVGVLEHSLDEAALKQALAEFP